MILRITFVNISISFLILLLSSFVFNGECQELVDKKEEKFVSIFPGFFVDADDDAVKIKFNIEELYTGRSLTSKQDAGNSNNNDDDGKKKPKVLQRIVGLLMMVPLMMQVLSLPGALASIKMSLLKSLIMGKISLIIMLYCLIQHLRSSSNVAVVHRPPPPPPQHYNHYYSSFDDDERWFG